MAAKAQTSLAFYGNDDVRTESSTVGWSKKTKDFRISSAALVRFSVLKRMMPGNHIDNLEWIAFEPQPQTNQRRVQSQRFRDMPAGPEQRACFCTPFIKMPRKNPPEPLPMMKRSKSYTLIFFPSLCGLWHTRGHDKRRKTV